MPELPEVETTLRGIKPHIEQNKIISVIVRQPNLRWPIPDSLPQTLTGQTIAQVTRRGKYLILICHSGALLIHLGMSGSLRIATATSSIRKHDHVDIIFDNGQCCRYHDPRRFGYILWTSDAIENHPLLSKLGPEPLTSSFSAEYLFAKTRKRKISIKPFIMDSHIVVGIGNIYANEALFLAKIRPTRAAQKMTFKQCDELVNAIKIILKKAINQGGTTLRDFVNSEGNPGYFKHSLMVYGRENQPCQICNKPLKHLMQNQRTTVYCASCQPP